MPSTPHHETDRRRPDARARAGAVVSGVVVWGPARRSVAMALRRSGVVVWGPARRSVATALHRSGVVVWSLLALLFCLGSGEASAQARTVLNGGFELPVINQSWLGVPDTNVPGWTSPDGVLVGQRLDEGRHRLHVAQRSEAQCRDLGHVGAIRQPHATLVEVRDPGVLAEPFEHPSVVLVLPRHLDVREQAGDHQDLRSRPPHLVGEACVAVVCVLDVGHAGHRATVPAAQLPARPGNSAVRRGFVTPSAA